MTQSVSTAVARRQKEDQLVGWLRNQQADIAMAAATHIKPSAIVRVTQGALRRNDKLAAAAIANPQSLLYALLDCARLGHEPDTDDYYLVPFGNEVTGIEGYKGIIERMFRAGAVKSVACEVVRRTDVYRPRGSTTPPLHEYDDFASDEDRGEMRGAYAYAILADGQCSQVIRMGKAEIMKHKAASRGADKPDSPWKKWEPAMWKKTVLRALEPYVPTSTEYRVANNIASPAAPTVMGAVIASTPAPVYDVEVVEDPSSAPGAGATDSASGPAPSSAATSQAPAPVDETAVPASAGQVQTITRHFNRLGYTADERDQRLAAISVITGRDITSTKELTAAEATTVFGIITKCKDRDQLRELVVSGEKPGTAGSDG